jgi:hypothetical protein
MWFAAPSPAQDIATLSAVLHRSSMVDLWRTFLTAAHKRCPRVKIKVETKARGPAQAFILRSES